VTAIPAAVRLRPAIAPRWLIAAAVLLTAAIVLLAAALASARQPAHAIVWGSLALAAYAVGLLCLVGGGQGSLLGLGSWRFGPWTLLWYFIAFGLASLSWVLPQTGTPAEISQLSVLRALWLVAVGLTLWAAGYLIGPGGPANRASHRTIGALQRRFTGDVRSPLTPWLLYAIGLTARIVLALTTQVFGYVGDVQSAVTSAPGYGQVLSVFTLFAPLAVAAAAMQVYRQRLPGARVTLTILFLAELAFGAAAGGKQDFIVTILAVVIPFAGARRRMPKGFLVALVLVFLLVVIPFNQAYRSAVRPATGPVSTSEGLTAAPGIMSQTLAGGDYATALPESVGFLVARIREIDSPAIVMQRTPGQVAFLSPVQLVEAPAAALVPRAIWPGKPLLDSGYQFSQVYYQLPAAIYTSSSVTPVADLYRHGGWVPVMAGMFLLGCGVRLLDNVIDVHANPHVIFLVLLLFPSLVKQEDDWVGLLAGIPGTLLIWLVATWLTFRRRQPA
jgi:hypothetical protein